MCMNVHETVLLFTLFNLQLYIIYYKNILRTQNKTRGEEIYACNKQSLDKTTTKKKQKSKKQKKKKRTIVIYIKRKKLKILESKLL